MSILQTDMAVGKQLHEDMQEHMDKFQIKDGNNIHSFIDKTSSQS